MTARISSTTEDDICRRYADGVSIGEIASSLGIEQSTIYRALKRRGVECQRYASSLSGERLQSIVDRYVSGESSVSLSRELKLTERFITGTIKRAGIPIRSPIEAHRNRNRTLDESVFDTLTEESSYWLGLLITDGCVYDKEKYQDRIVLSLQGEDREHVASFGRFVGTAVVPKIRVLKYIRKDGSPSTVCRLAISSNRISKALAGFGIVPRKSLTAKVIGLEDNRDFWRGVVDGDGGFGYTNKRSPQPCPFLQLCGGRGLIDQFIQYCNRVANVGNVTINTNKLGECCEIKLHGENARRMARILYSLASVSLPRKQVMADEFMNFSDTALFPGW